MCVEQNTIVNSNRFNFNFWCFKSMLLCALVNLNTLILCSYFLFVLFFIFEICVKHRHKRTLHYIIFTKYTNSGPSIHIVFCNLRAYKIKKLYTKITCDGIYCVHIKFYTHTLRENRTEPNQTNQTKPGKRLQKYMYLYVYI